MLKGHQIGKKRTYGTALVMAYRQLAAAFEQGVAYDELQGAVENLLDAVRAEARAEAHRRHLHSWKGN